MKNCEDKAECGSRREFLVRASALAGGLVLTLSGAAGAQDKGVDKQGGTDAAMKKSAATTGDEAVLRLDEKSPLNKIGGFDTIDTKAGKVVVVRLSETDFKAYSAICPHKNGPIKYDEATKQLFCPWHNSRFDTTGKVVKGPAKKDLQAFSTQEAVVVTLAPKA